MPKMEIWAGVRGAKKAVRSYDKMDILGRAFAPPAFKLGMRTAGLCSQKLSCLVFRSSFDCHYVTMIEISAAHPFCFSNIL